MKNKTTAGILALLIGSFGAHKFYLGKTGMGILYFLFFWTLIPGIAAFIEGIIFLTMTDEAFNMKYNYMYPLPPNQRIYNSSNFQSESEINHLKEKGKLIVEEAKIILKNDLDKGIISPELYEVRLKQLLLDAEKYK